ncbi:MAG: AI-2E family transporter [Blastocatellia bacterium]
MLVRWIALLVAAGIALYVCWLMLQPFAEVLAWAAVLVIVFFPVHQRLVAWLRRPGWSALLSTALVMLVILVPVTLVTIAVVNELTELVQNLQGSFSTLLGPHSPVIGRITGWLSQYIDVSRLHPQEYLMQRLNSLSENLASRTIGLVGGVFGAVIEVFFIIFTMYYLFRDSDRIRRALRDVIPLEREQSEQIFERTREVIYASVYGVLVIAAIQGALGGLAFWMLGLPSALVWSVVMFLLSMVPMAGSFLVWIPAAAWLALMGHPGKALMLTAWGLLAIGTVDNFLRPRLVGQKTRLHELLIFFSVLGGLQIFGVLGLVLGPVIVAVTLALMDIFRQMDRSFRFTLSEPSVIDRQAELRNIHS